MKEKLKISLVISLSIEKVVEEKSQPKKKLSFKEQRELEQIEKDMPNLEKKRDAVLVDLNNESEYEKIAKLSAELEEISGNLELLELRWLELQEMMG